MEYDRAQEQARRSVAGHHAIAAMVETLENSNDSPPSGLSFAKKPREQVTHHLDEEEDEEAQDTSNTRSMTFV